MADRRGNVIVLPGRGGAGHVQRDHLEALRAIVGQLDELRQRLQEFSPRPGWSAKRWMIASTPFRMRLTGANRSLGDLTRLNASSEQSAIRSVFQLNDACRAASQRLHDIEACLGMLQSAEAPPAERARETDLFASSRSGLLAALSEIRRLIVQRFPDVLVENLWKSSGTAGGTRGGSTGHGARWRSR